MADDRFQTGRKEQESSADGGSVGGDSVEEPPYESRRNRRAVKRRNGALELLLIAVLAFGLVFGVVRPFIVEAFVIPSGSMIPTLQIGDRVLANKFIYDFTDPERGDVVVFESVETEGQDLIKRVIGTPGDTVEIRGDTLYVNGEPRQGSYLNADSGDGLPQGQVEVPEDSYFVMGDNRGNSADSRAFGPVPEENIEGEAFVIFWPVTRISGL